MSDVELQSTVVIGQAPIVPVMLGRSLGRSREKLRPLSAVRLCACCAASSASDKYDPIVATASTPRVSNWESPARGALTNPGLEDFTNDAGARWARPGSMI